MLVIPDTPFSACIFDCDGTLVDSMPLHLDAWRAALQKHGFPPEKFTLKMHHEVAGMPGPAIVEKLNREFGYSLSGEQVEIDKIEWYMAHHSEVKPIAPVVEFARSMHGKMPLAVASGSDAVIVHESLKAIGIFELFETVVTPADVALGKPAPDMFLLAAKRMGVLPEECLVFEDGLLGIQAAEAAGMKTVFIETHIPDED